jgi:phytoene synthase
LGASQAATTQESDPASLEHAFAWCKEYTRARAKNFYYAFVILPPEKRQAIYAAYAFSGLVDDIADELTDPEEQRRRLAEASEQLHTCVTGDATGELFSALGWAIRRFDIPIEHFEELIKGVEMDFTIDRYATWHDLRQYCYRVASAVGLICTAVFGTRQPELAHEAAVDMGLALQITNIMRDVREDAARGRVYFPTTDLTKHGLQPEDILAGTSDERFTALMADYGRRARRHFRSGRRLLPLLDVRSRMCCNVMQGVYFSILKEIEKRHYDVLSERVRINDAKKVALIGKLWATAALTVPR